MEDLVDVGVGGVEGADFWKVFERLLIEELGLGVVPGLELQISLLLQGEDLMGDPTQLHFCLLTTRSLLLVAVQRRVFPE